jgi:crotonobetainyl-CoA:carnitine CoA-transferase CaiB-like acyl-CoA transferase
VGPAVLGRGGTLFLSLNRNKKSLAVDLKREGGTEIVRRLIGRADVFVQSPSNWAVAG